MDTFQTGALIDTRPQEEKDKDFHLAETVAAVNPVVWIEKPQDQWRKFPIFNQNGSGSCVAQTIAKLTGILYWLANKVYVHFSATHVYQRRANKPMTGMAGVDAFNIARESITLEQLVPSQNLADFQMDGALIEKYKDDVGKIFKIGNFVVLPMKDIEAIASVIQTTGKAVMLFFFWKIDEWTEAPTIKYPDLTLANSEHHSVAGVEATLYKGEKAIVIEDSWGSSFGMAGQRVITESFFKQRNFFAAYPIGFKFQEQGIPKPHYTFTKDLKFIAINEATGEPADPVLNAAQKADVVALQDILKYEGYMPVNTASTGYYGAITARGVLQWQKAHKVDTEAALNALAGKAFGAKSRAAANPIYGA